MSDPTITRDLLQAALSKAADNGDMAAFERIITAMGGLATAVGEQPGHTDTTDAIVAARPMRGFTYGDGAKAEIRAVTAKRLGGNRG